MAGRYLMPHNYHLFLHFWCHTTFMDPHLQTHPQSLLLSCLGPSLPVRRGARRVQCATIMQLLRRSVFWRRLAVSARRVIFLSEVWQQSLVCHTLSLWSGPKICTICNPTPGHRSGPDSLDQMGNLYWVWPAHVGHCRLPHWWVDACFFHSTHVDQTLCLCLQFFTVSQTMLIKNDPAWKR